MRDWANDPVTRAASFHPATIDRRGHLRWLAARLASPSTRLLIGVTDGPVGQVRLELGPDGACEIGIAVAPDRRRQGLATRLLDAAIGAARGDPAYPVERFIARIRVGNVASVRLFEGRGFRLRSQERCEGYPCLVYELPG